MSKRARPDNGSSSNRLFLYVPLALAVLGLAFIGVMILLNSQDRQTSNPDVVLPMLLIGGVVALLLTIAVVAVVYNQRELTTKEEPLGLPPGSVRAIIALSLILIFAIMALFLYSTLLKGSETTSTVTVEQVASLQQQGVTILSITPTGRSNAAGEALFRVQVSVPANSDARDFAKQVLTTISTLVVAIAAFYFGTQATAAGVAATRAGAGPTLDVVDPKSPAPWPSSGDVLIIVHPSMPGAKIIGYASTGQLSQLDPSDVTRWSWKPPDERNPAGAEILFMLADNPDVTARLQIDGGTAATAMQGQTEQGQT